MMDVRSYTGFNGPADRDGLLSPPDGRALDRFERKSTETGELTTGVETAVDELHSMLERRMRAILDVAEARAAEIEREAEQNARQRKQDSEAMAEDLTRLSVRTWRVLDSIELVQSAVGGMLRDLRADLESKTGDRPTREELDSPRSDSGLGETAGEEPAAPPALSTSVDEQPLRALEPAKEGVDADNAAEFEIRTEAKSDFNLYLRLLREARGYRLHIAAMLLISLLATPLALLTPLPLLIAVDTVVGSDPLPSFLDATLPAAATASDSGVLALAAALVLIIAALTQLQAVTSEVFGAYVGEKLLVGFRANLFRHVQRLSLSYHDNKGTADSIYRIQYDAPAIQWIAVHGVTPLVTAALVLVGMIYVTARIDWLLAVVALGVSPPLIVLTSASRRRLRSGWRATKVLESGALSIAQEVLTALRVVKAFGQEEREQERFVSRLNEGVGARIRLAFVEGGFAFLIGLTTAVGTAAVLYIGVTHVQSGLLSLGELVLVMGYLAQLYVPLQQMSLSINTLQSSLASAERAFSLLHELPDVRERPDARPLDRAVGHVAFRNVSMAYDAARPVLHDISFELATGRCVGIAGTTGSGKTTLVNLLTRFYDPTGGQIVLDGVDLRDYKLTDLRKQFAVTLQEPVLFSTSIAENIAYARPDATTDELVNAAKAANAHDFILELPDGYATIVGERGMTLSGGERQRISLARAFLKDAPILILDEPTSAVDVKTEAAIMEAIERLIRGRTTFIIAHRPSTLEWCDVKLQLEEGRVARFSPAPTSRRYHRSAALPLDGRGPGGEGSESPRPVEGERLGLI